MDDTRRYSRICREGFVYLFVLAFIIGGALLRQVNLLIVMAGLMMGLLVFNWRVAVATVRRLRFRRALPRHVRAGDVFLVDVVAENGRRRLDSWAVTVEDSIRLEHRSRPEQSAKAQVLFAHIGAGATSRARYRCCFNQRGSYRLGPLHVATRFPLGFIQASRTIQQIDRLVVWPRLGRLRPEWHQLVETNTAGRQQPHRGRGLVDGDYYGLRDWRPGDNKRWIHWRATAKLGDLTVFEFEQPRHLDLALILDLWQPAPAGHRQRERVEAAVSFAATAVADVCRRGGRRLRLAIAGATSQLLCGLPSAKLMHEAMEQLATADGGDTNHLEDALADALDGASLSTRIVVISTRAADPGAWSRAVQAADRSDAETALARLVWIDVGSDQLGRWFELESTRTGVATR